MEDVEIAVENTPLAPMLAATAALLMVIETVSPVGG
jgi:hypothetical protein